MHLCKTYDIKFIIFLALSILVLVYYFLEVSLITFVATSYVSFFVVKFIISLAFFFKNKKNEYLFFNKIIILNTN